MLILSPKSLGLILLSSGASANSLPELPPGPSIDRIRGTFDIPLLSFWQFTGLCVGLTLLGSFLIIFFYRRIRAINKPIDHISPYYSALNALNELNSEKDCAQVGEKIIYTLCQFFEASLNIKAHGRSCSVISQQLDLDKTDNERLIEIWNDCNHAKFGQSKINKESRTQMINMSVLFINAVHASEVQEEN